MNLAFIKNEILNIFSEEDKFSAGKKNQKLKRDKAPMEHCSNEDANISEIDKMAIENFMQEMLQSEDEITLRQARIEELKRKQLEIINRKNELKKKVNKTAYK